VDANGLALMCFAFGSLAFFIFKCNIDYVNWGNEDDPTKNHPGVHMLTGMLTWGCGAGLLIAGIFQFFNGDHLGFTSYILHATILGTTGYWVDDLLAGFGTSTYIFSYYYYAVAWFDIVLAIKAFSVAKMFGVLYLTVAMMFFVVGLDWSQKMDDSNNDPTSHTGSYLSGISCLIVASQCFYILVPVMTGKGILK